MINKPASALFIGMGMGKTAIALTAVDDLLFYRAEIRIPLIIAPLEVAKNVWTDEAEKWDHLKHLTFSKIIGSETERVRALRTKADIYIINRENVMWLEAFLGGHWPFDMVVIDESSSFKSHEAKRFHALQMVRSKIKRIVLLTGTPGLLKDLWAQIFLLDQGERLGPNITYFKRRYFDKDEYRLEPKEGAQQAIHSKISDLCISMKAEDYLELPPYHEYVQKLSFDPDLRRQYDAFEEENIIRLFSNGVDTDIIAMNAAALSTKLLQFSSGFLYDEKKNVFNIHNLKLEALKETVEEAQGEPMIVFYHYLADRTRITKYLKKYNPVHLKEPDALKRWNKGQIKVLLMHPANGYGLNMQQGGRHMTWYTSGWSLELDQQSIARLKRQGQTKPVICKRLAIRGTIDMDVLRAKEKKTNEQNALFEAVKARIDKYIRK